MLFTIRVRNVLTGLLHTRLQTYCKLPAYVHTHCVDFVPDLKHAINETSRFLTRDAEFHLFNENLFHKNYKRLKIVSCIFVAKKYVNQCIILWPYIPFHFSD